VDEERPSLGSRGMERDTLLGNSGWGETHHRKQGSEKRIALCELTVERHTNREQSNEERNVTGNMHEERRSFRNRGRRRDTSLGTEAEWVTVPGEERSVPPPPPRKYRGRDAFLENEVPGLRGYSRQDEQYFANL
jgi:hypothetical protein